MSDSSRDELEALVDAGWHLVVLESFEEDRALELVESVAKERGQPCHRWSLASGLGAAGEGAGSLVAGLAAMARIEEPGIFVLLDAHRLLDDALALRVLRDQLPTYASRDQFLVALGPAFDLPVELQREAGRMQLPLPKPPELEPHFAAVLDEECPDSSRERLDEALRAAAGLTVAEAIRVFRRALQQQGALDSDALRAMLAEKRRALRRSPALAFHETDTDLDDVGGLEELKRWLAERRRAFGPEARRFGLPLPRGLLLLGVQGCGKSLSAKAVARAWGFPLLRLDLATAFGDASARPEAVLREAIAVAESLAPAVLWIDEIEKGFASSSNDPTASRVFGSFLTWLAEKRSPVFVVATANDVSGLPPELLRRGRLDDLFFVDLPSANERAEILGIHLRKHGRDPLQHGITDLAAEAEGLSGAEIEQVVGAALFSAFAAGRELGDEDLANAIAETVPLYDTYEERIKELRDWARGRARPASLDARLVDLFAERRMR